jgi:membrane protease YdiL (CAAX protease family)
MTAEAGERTLSMNLRELRSDNPPMAVRVLLVFEVLAYVALLSLYIWFVLQPIPGGADMGLTIGGKLWYRIAAAAVLVILPIALNLLHGDRAADSGLRLDNIKASARLVVPATLVLAAGVIVVAFAMHSWEWLSYKRFGDRLGGYLVWGMFQQYLLQAFSLRRLRQARLPIVAAVIVAAGLFGLIHAPNWWLVAGTTMAGIVWCGIFVRVPNLLTLGAAHAAMGVLLYHAWYAQTHALTIGPAFWRWH